MTERSSKYNAQPVAIGLHKLATQGDIEMPNYAFAKVDANHKEIREIVRAAGYVWIDTYRQGDGCPDAFVLSKSKRWIAFEIKSDGGGLTDAEAKMFDYVGPGAPLYTVTCYEAALEILAFYDIPN
jgi:hypothetical protein